MKQCTTEYIKSHLDKNLSNLFLLYSPALRETGKKKKGKKKKLLGFWKCFHNVSIILKETVSEPFPIPLQRHIFTVNAYIEEKN